MRGHFITVASVISVATAVRLLQLLLSSLPLNIDSYAQISIAQGMLQTGHWSLSEGSANAYNQKMPFLPLLLATTSAVTGAQPLTLSIPLIILVSLAGILGIYALAYTLSRSRGVAAVSALVLALLGPYVFLSSTLMKEALALALLPILVLAFLRRQDGRMRGLAGLILITLPLIHHLSTLMGYGFISLTIVLQHAQAYWRGRWSWRRLTLDLILGPGLFSFAVWYYTYVRLEFFSDVWRTNEIALFLATALLVSSAGLLLMSHRRARPWFALSKSRRLASLVDQKTLVIIGAILLVLANSRRALFPGTVLTSPLLLGVAVAYIPLAVLALVGINVFRLSGGLGKAVILSLILVPFTVILFAFLRGLDPLSHTLVYRSFDFLDYGLALGVGTALFRKMSSVRRAAIATVVSVALLTTLPLAYSTEALLQVQNTTYEYELSTIARLEEGGATTVLSDQRLGDVMAMAAGIGGDRTLPFMIVQGRRLPPGSTLLLEEQWASRGAQVHPQPFLLIEEELLAGVIKENNLVYHSGDSANSLYLVLVRD